MQSIEWHQILYNTKRILLRRLQFYYGDSLWKKIYWKQNRIYDRCVKIYLLDDGFFLLPSSSRFSINFILLTIYSHLKHFTEIPKHINMTAPITTTDSRTFSVGNPRNVTFINWIPCVIGKILIIFCIATGITSNGSVVPEKIRIGKHKIQAMTLI